MFAAECLQKRQICGHGVGVKSQSVLAEIATNIRDKKTYGGYQNAISFHVLSCAGGAGKMNPID